MNMRPAVITALACAAAGLTTALITAAAMSGPLDPPAGSVAPTYKTLTEVEPRTPISDATTPGDATTLFRITQPGSYYLTGNITAAAGRDVIHIEASDVQLDLNGFTITAVPTAPTAIAGIGASDRIRVRNGSITGFSSAAVDLAASTACQIESISATAGGTGIAAGLNSLVRHCTASGNTGSGISLGLQSLAENCVAYDNGAFGITASASASITACSASNNGDAGIRITGSGRVSGCVTSSNGFGPDASFKCGIRAAGSSTVTDCTANGNAFTGIEVNTDSTVSRCLASSNQHNGITAGAGSHVLQCTAGNNADNGIEVSRECRVTANHCHDNGFPFNGSGILATDTRNRIDDNNVVRNNFGIRAAGSQNILTRNTASGNPSGNYNVAFGNAAFAVQTSIDFGFIGPAGGTPFGTEDPWANLSFGLVE